MIRKPSKPLFFTLFSSFILVLIIPCVAFLIFYMTLGERNITRALRTQGISSLENDSVTFENILSSYLSKAAEIATDEIVISCLAGRDVHPQKVYNILYSVMKNETYTAAAHIESADGRKRFSTHSFPEMYDLRIHSNTWDQSNVLSRLNAKNEDEFYFTIRNHSLELGHPILISVAKPICSEGEKVGVVILDIFFEAFAGKVNRVNLFSEEMLVDKRSYNAVSLMNSRKFGSFADFPELANDAMVITRDLDADNFQIIGVPNKEPFRLILSDIFRLILLILFLGIIVATFISIILAHNINDPIQSLRKDMESAEGGDLDIRFQECGIKEVNELGTTFNNMLSQISQLMRLTREEEAKLAEAERKTLESQLNPHFLFNTLNTIKAIARLHGEKEIYTISLKLGTLLRASISHNESECTVLESLQMAEDYLTIQKLRFGDKLKFAIDCEKSAEYVLTPRLIIQPLVENAIIHGLEEKEDDDWNIAIGVKVYDSKTVTITVADNGVGIEKGVIPENFEQLKHTKHVGLYNIYRRLELRYGKDASFNIESTPGIGTAISITVPYRVKKGIS
jgi:Predicted signal transduction protein with a C-terminal ATPase domain